MAGNRRRGLCFAAAIILLGAGVAGFGVGSSGGDDAGAANPPTPTIVSGAPVVPKHFRGDLRALPPKGPPGPKEIGGPGGAAGRLPQTRSDRGYFSDATADGGNAHAQHELQGPRPRQLGRRVACPTRSATSGRTTTSRRSTPRSGSSARPERSSPRSPSTRSGRPRAPAPPAIPATAAIRR